MALNAVEMTPAIFGVLTAVMGVITVPLGAAVGAVVAAFCAGASAGAAAGSIPQEDQQMYAGAGAVIGAAGMTFIPIALAVRPVKPQKLRAAARALRGPLLEDVPSSVQG